jgi:hypothetical protein
MDTYLWDLGRRRQAALLQWRAASLNPQFGGARAGAGVMTFAPAAGAQSKRLGPLTRLWASGAESPPEAITDALVAMRGQVQGVTFGLVCGSIGIWIPTIAILASGYTDAGTCVVGGFMAAMGTLMSGAGLWMPGRWLRRVCRPPLAAAEVEALLTTATDELEKAYLRLIADVVRQAVAPEAAERVREALRAVGEAIDQLPAVAVPRAGEGALREEAARARDEARREADPVVAASHERRADALERSADAALRSQVLTRRASALREEMLAQVESLRMGLAGFETASGDVAGLASLADAVRSVAVESLSMADARVELDTALSGGLPPEKILRLGVSTQDVR